MAQTILMQNKSTGQMKEGFFGFSWTYLFFGFFVPIFRGEIGIAALHWFLSCITGGLFWIFMSFFYNRQYTERLIEKGFVFAGSPSENAEAALALGVRSNL